MVANDDERAIRELVAEWMEASTAGDHERTLGLIADDALFMVPGQEPFDKAAFARASKAQSGMRFEATSAIQEIRVLGDWAYLRNLIALKITQANGQIIERRGYTLTILRKGEAGQWQLVRDANLVGAGSPQ